MPVPSSDRPVPTDPHHVPQWLGARAKRRFHVMAKPAGAACNLDCAYCFYLSKPALAHGPGLGRMDDDTLERFVRDYIDSVTGDEVVFSWQGGEPTLCGLDFFRKVVALQHKHAKPTQRIDNDLQTNGTLLDEDWARFLEEHRFLVGLSIDGPREIHDRCRITKRGAPTFDRVFAAARLLQRFGVPFNTLTCVSRHNAKRPLDVYRFLRRELGATYLQFIPIVEPRDFATTAPHYWHAARLPVIGSPEARPGHPDSVVTDWSVDPDEYGYFLCKVWDEWLSRDLGKVLVSFCETLVVQRMGMPAQVCVHGEFCGKGVAIEHDGSVYACDHYVYPEYRLGCVRDASLGDMVFSPAQVKFGYAKAESLPAHCRHCAFLRDCWGECPKNRLLRTPEGEPGLNYLCSGLKRFFGHAGPAASRMAAQLLSGAARPR
ncbi:MAG: anaerobic sulfatase maturase [Burkholderiales bacterium]|nr:anaerobic sulfatase maturase [Burkholderiales bacterium]